MDRQDTTKDSTMTRWGAAAIGAALLLVALTASASSSTQDPITACLSKNGNLRVVADETECRSKEQALSWNHEGPQGPAGPAGPSGPVGPPGAPGADATASLDGASCTFDGADGESLAVTDATGQITLFCVVAGVNDPTSWYRDRDGDGHGSATGEILSPQPVTGYAATAGDCDDDDPFIHPDAGEKANDIDDDCDGSIDEDLQPWYHDGDGDGYGDPAQVTYMDDQPLDGPFVPNDGDCDDSRSDVNPSASEIDDGIDNDCDNLIDES